MNFSAVSRRLKVLSPAASLDRSFSNQPLVLLPGGFLAFLRFPPFFPVDQLASSCLAAP